MNARELASGLWRWTAPHPAWTPDRAGSGGWEQSVGSIYYEAAEALVLIDPLVPPPETSDAQRFWAAFDRDVERTSLPVVILVGSASHGRSADSILARYAARRHTSIHVHADARSRVSCTATNSFEDGATLPGGVEAHAIRGLDPGETAFWIGKHRALVFADAVIGTGAGRVEIAPRSWAPDGERAGACYANEFRASLERLLRLEPLLLLPSHGDPVLEAGATALSRAVAAPAGGKG